MNSLAGLFVATYPGLKGHQVICYCCGIIVPRRQKVYRLEEQSQVYGKRSKVVGHLCRKCRKALGPAKKGRYFTRIEGNTKKASS